MALFQTLKLVPVWRIGYSKSVLQAAAAPQLFMPMQWRLALSRQLTKLNLCVFRMQFLIGWCWNVWSQDIQGKCVWSLGVVLLVLHPSEHLYGPSSLLFVVVTNWYRLQLQPFTLALQSRVNFVSSWDEWMRNASMLVPNALVGFLSGEFRFVKSQIKRENMWCFSLNPLSC